MPKRATTPQISGPWDQPAVDAFLRATSVPMRLAVNTSSGFPTVTPLWFLWQEGSLWAAAKPDAAIIRLLRRDGRCAFDISPETPPYHGVRGKGEAIVLEDGLPILRTLVDRYMGDRSPEFRTWLLGRSADECAVRIEPARITSWDFRKRMQK
jgi:nitroimidazol reductase NimA-like FMN-containing flavoprotein (pyridoxamine 5'-phosphate oxidase superfamily)